MPKRRRKTSWAVESPQQRSARSRRCPGCGRGAALSRSSDSSIGTFTSCRWDDCQYLRIQVFASQMNEQANSPAWITATWGARLVRGTTGIYIRPSKKVRGGHDVER